MEIKGKGLCVLGGLYFTIDYLLGLLEGLIEFLTAPIGIITQIMLLVFVILLVVGLFKKERFNFLERFITKFPKFSVYMHYIGCVSFILYIIGAVTLPIILSESFVSPLKVYLIWGIVALNYGGEIVALIIATRKVFFQPKTSENK